MLKRTMAVVVALVMAMTAGSVFAQSQCVIGVYADTEGTLGYYQPTEAQEFHVYVVMNLQDTIKAASYTLNVPGLYTEIIPLSVLWGPFGTGVAIPEIPGNLYIAGVDVGIGDCVNGYTGLPVLIADYTFIILGDVPPRTLSVGPYRELYPEYVTCFNDLALCEIGPDLVIDAPIANDSRSWGAVKSLFGN